MSKWGLLHLLEGLGVEMTQEFRPKAFRAQLYPLLAYSPLMILKVALKVRTYPAQMETSLG